ncbi:hemolysin family protein [Hoyosella altamirensis]|uniref:CBS domain containing-hemolysin-like protein n=1 Tax=Hoyosella altamirensis TaxID=616997 RepID=A0A839RV11_9ACTN|nr:hemolysin family protein [Hoyosella altamirensis]MBB3040058.1 CBS domain containing-hemolysin-like protein [Hoyosella altamirensis]
MVDITGMVIGIALLLGNAFFVGAEFALIAARRTQIEPRAAAGSRSARITLRALERVSLMMAGAQLGITMCSLGLGAVAEPAIAYALEVPLEALGVPSALLHPIALVIALTIVLSLHMTIGEMVPKNIAIAGPERSALLLGPPLYAIVLLFKPLLIVINSIANLVLRLLRVTPREEVASAFTADEVAGIIDEAKREGLLDPSTYTLLAGSVAIAEDTVTSIMVPLNSLVTTPVDTRIGELQQTCITTGYSRIPTTDSAGTITGYVHIKDILDLDTHTVLPAEHIRQITRVTATTSLDDVLSDMQSLGTHVALVTSNDSTDTIGAAMLEDVIEKLVGEIADTATKVS